MTGAAAPSRKCEPQRRCRVDEIRRLHSLRLGRRKSMSVIGIFQQLDFPLIRSDDKPIMFFVQ